MLLNLSISLIKVSAVCSSCGDVVEARIARSARLEAALELYSIEKALKSLCVSASKSEYDVTPFCVFNPRESKDRGKIGRYL